MRKMMKKMKKMSKGGGFNLPFKFPFWLISEKE
jgi:hypothetical protein